MENVILRTSSGEEVELGTVDEVAEHTGSTSEGEEVRKDESARYIATILAQAVDELIDDPYTDAEIAIVVR